MKNKKTILSALMLILAICLLLISNKHNENLVSMAYNASGAKFVTCNINSYSILKNKTKLDTQKLLQIQKDICINLKLKDYEIDDQQNNMTDTINQVTIKLSDEIGRIFNIKVECYKVDENSYTNYVYIDASLDSDINNLSKTYNAIKSCYKQFRIKPTINTCAVGAFEGKLNDQKLTDIKDKINNITKIRIVENIKYLNSQSITAYNPNLSQYILSNGKKINLNYALRYNTLENRTYIYIASPIINIEY